MEYLTHDSCQCYYLSYSIVTRIFIHIYVCVYIYSLFEEPNNLNQRWQPWFDSKNCTNIKMRENWISTCTADCMSADLSFASQMAVTASLTNLLKLTLRNSSIKPSRCSSLICFNFLMTAVLRLMLESNVLRKPESRIDK